MTLAILAARSLLTRWRTWLWTEWAALACAAIIAGCWFYDEFVARPALDRTVRVVLLGTWLLVIASSRVSSGHGDRSVLIGGLVCSSGRAISRGESSRLTANA